MTSKKRQPFIISRANSNRSSVATMDRTSSNSFEDLNPGTFQRQSSFLSKQNSLNFHDSAFKSHFSVPKIDSNMMPDLLEKYSQENLQYRDEEFTQQAESFIMKIAADKRIPKELRAKFPLYQILLSICKIFMLNEYEIMVFACSLDHCNWKIDDVVLPEEADFLKEFPSNFGVEISDECKRFIMYLLIITFSLKQYLNEKTNVDRIQAYCEKICESFQTLFNRWTKISSFQKFNYSAPEINRKFKYLSKREYGDQMNSVKDYNMIVDNIMTLTGSYCSKPKTEAKTVVGTALPSPIPSSNNNVASQKTEVFHDLASLPILEPKFFPELSQFSGIERGLSRTKAFDFTNESSGIKMPNILNGLSRQNSISNILGSMAPINRQGSFEFFEELQRKLFNKQEVPTNQPNGSNHHGTLIQPIPRKDISGTKLPDLSSLSGLLRSGDPEDLLNIALPLLSTKSSAASQQQLLEELPGLSRFNSNFSFLYDNK